MVFYAHSLEDQDETKWQNLVEHLEHVADLARTFAEDFKAGDWGYAAGLRHDLGKASPDYQKRLRGQAQKVDHSTAGAQQIVLELEPTLAKLIAACIAGHHGGLQDGVSGEDSCLARRLRKEIPEIADKSLLSRPPISGKLLLPWKLKQQSAGFQLALFARMVYSCLVDADFLDTERFLDPQKASWRGGFPRICELYSRFSERMKQEFANPEPGPINFHRGKILQACIDKAKDSPGLFSLTVPTGGGKTLSSLAFALEHARRHGLKRIVYVIPFTSIIEQNADVFRRFLGTDAVVEHHSAFDTEKQFGKGSEESEIARKFELASENWDAPVIVSTGVQFFESLFAAKPSRCRKLHNLARSVIILDEAQMLPIRFLAPCVQALEELAANYGSSVVLCTATQPSLQKTEHFKLGLAGQVREIMSDPRSLYETFRRVSVENAGELSLQDLAARVKENERVLCIVNTRREARELFEEIAREPGTFHLSALMCPEHRTRKLREIKQRLRDGKACRLISTRLIEAGVDIDFPIVFRAIAGIDSIAQAAGRCNREGKEECGRVVVFKMSGRKLPLDFRPQADSAAEIILKHSDHLSLDAVDGYFRLLYWKYGDQLDAKQVIPRFQESWRDCFFPFRSIAEDFQIIFDAGEPLVVPFDETARGLIRDLEWAKFPGKILRGLQRYAVQAPFWAMEKIKRGPWVKMVQGVYPVMTEEGFQNCYDPEMGLDLGASPQMDPESLVFSEYT